MISKKLRKSLRKNWELYLLITPVVAYYLVFHYAPMYGIQIAFKNYIPTRGIWGSPWIGFEHFQTFFESFYFSRLITNTITISMYSLLVGFPAPIILAIVLNEVRHTRLRRVSQTITYAPYFLSTVVVVGMILIFLSPKSGLVNHVIRLFHGDPVFFMSEPAYFKTIYVLSGVWQTAGFGSIVYMAALAGIDQELYSAAIVDGASRFQRLIYITIPFLVPTITILFILNIGSIMNVGFEKVFLMQNELNIKGSDVISTFVYRRGIREAQFSFASAVGFFNSIINFVVLVTANSILKRIGETSLW